MPVVTCYRYGPVIDSDMFKLRQLTDVYEVNNKELLLEIVSGHHGPVTAIWTFPGHVCIALDGGHRLVSLDVQPCSSVTPLTFSQTSAIHRHGNIDLELTDALISNVLVRRGDPHTLFVIQTNGIIQLLKFVEMKWKHIGNLNLNNTESGETTTTVISAVIHETFNAIYWTETEPLRDSPNGHRIGRASLLPRTEQGDSWDITDRTVVMENCPLCDLYAVQNRLIIIPREPCPAGVYFSVSQISNTVTTHIVTRGRSQSHDKLLGKPLDFRELVMKQFGFWSQDIFHHPKFTVFDPHAQLVYSFYEDGALIDMAQNKVICVLKVTEEMTTYTDCFAFRKYVILVTRQSLKVHSVVSGRLVHQIELADSETYMAHSRPGNAGVPQVVILTTGHLYLLQLTNMKQIRVIDSCNEGLKKPGQADAMSQKIMNIAVHHYQERSMTRQKITVEMLEGSGMFQSPGVLVNLLLQAQGHQSHTETWSKLQQILQIEGSTADTLMSQLTQTLGAQLREYRGLEDQILKCFEEVAEDFSGCTQYASVLIREKVGHLLSDSSSLSVEQKRADLIAMATHFQDQTMAAIFHYLDFPNGGETSPIKRMKWERMLGVCSSGRHGDEGEMLDIVCSLIYTHKPAVMLEFAEEAEKILNPDGDFSQRNELICQRILSHLPCPEKSTDVATAAVVLANLTVKSGLLQSHQVALEVLLRLDMREQAFSFVAQCAQLESDHTELFQALLKSAIKERFISHYCSQIFYLKPANMSVTELLELIQEDLPPDGSAVFCDGASIDIPVSLLQPFIQQALHKP